MTYSRGAAREMQHLDQGERNLLFLYIKFKLYALPSL